MSVEHEGLSQAQKSERFVELTTLLAGRLSESEILRAASASEVSLIDAMREHFAVKSEAADLRKDANAEEIVSEKRRIRDLIDTESAKLRELLGERIETLLFRGDDTDGTKHMTVEVNAKYRRATRKSENSSASRGSGRKATTFALIDGEPVTARGYIERYGTDADREHSYYKDNAWPTQLAREIHKRETGHDVKRGEVLNLTENESETYAVGEVNAVTGKTVTEHDAEHSEAHDNSIEHSHTDEAGAAVHAHRAAIAEGASEAEADAAADFAEEEAKERNK